MSSLAIYTYTYNCVRIKYPFVESIRSSLALADAVYWCDCESDDGTWEIACEMASADSRIKLHRRPWGTHYSVQPQICNEVLELIGQRFDFALQVQADEVACEWSFATFRNQLEQLPKRMVLLRPFYRNFCPDYRTTFPFIYERKAVGSRCAANARWHDGIGGDACALVGFPQTDAALEIHHYGKVDLGRRREALTKELTHQRMYVDLGFPAPGVMAQESSGEMNYSRLFADATFTPYRGPHPATMAETIAIAERRRDAR